MKRPNNKSQVVRFDKDAASLLAAVLKQEMAKIEDGEVLSAFNKRLNDENSELVIVLLKEKEPECVLTDVMTDVFNRVIDRFKAPTTGSGDTVKRWLESCVAVSVTFKAKELGEVRFILGEQSRYEEIESAFMHPDDVFEFKFD